MCPEFLREGSAVKDFLKPDRIVIGKNSDISEDLFLNIFSPFIRENKCIIFMDTLSAELTKYASNSFLATKISFMNELSIYADLKGADIEKVRMGIGLDKRIGSRFLRAGPAYGGSCFPKDTKAIVSTADKFKSNLSVIKSVIKSNHNRSDLLLKRLHSIIKKINNKNVSFLGVTFKANTDDMRDSSSLKLIPFLSKKGAKIKYYDPTGSKKEFNNLKNVEYANSIQNCIEGSDLIIIHTEWSLLSNKSDLFWLDLITLLITVKFDLNLSAVDTIAFVSFGKQEPP